MVQVAELPFDLKLKLVRQVLPGEEGLARKVVEYFHEVRRNPSITMRILQSLIDEKGGPLRFNREQLMLARAGIRVSMETLEIKRAIRHELTLISERIIDQRDGTYFCRFCSQYLNGPEQAEDHSLGKKHRMLSRRQRLHEEGLRGGDLQVRRTPWVDEVPLSQWAIRRLDI